MATSPIETLIFQVHRNIPPIFVEKFPQKRRILAVEVYFLGFQESHQKAREPAPTMDALAIGLVLLGLAIFVAVMVLCIYRSKQLQEREVTWMKSGEPRPDFNQTLTCTSNLTESSFHYINWPCFCFSKSKSIFTFVSLGGVLVTDLPERGHQCPQLGWETSKLTG